MDKKNIVFTGGGSGGHSVVAMTLIKYFRSQGVSEISYIGSSKGIERSLCEKNKIPYYSISTGKLRRYFSFQNALDFFKVFWGIVESFYLLLTTLRKTDVVFSTGGFVSVPASLAGKVLGKKVYLHEQTTRVGLANKIVAKLADKVFLSFDSSIKYFPKQKSMVVGYPLRKAFKSLDLKTKEFHGIDLVHPKKKIIFITGGGNGAFKLNELVKKYYEQLTQDFIVIHQTGKKFLEEYKDFQSENYLPVGFIGDEFPDLLKSSSLIICRAGAGTVSELMAIKSNVLFIPLKIAQQNEQYHNAVEALKYVNGKILLEDELDRLDLVSIIKDLHIESSKAEILPSNSAELIFEELSKNP